MNHVKMRQVLNNLKLRNPGIVDPFLKPVSEQDAPKYSTRVRKPMCIEWIWDKLALGREKYTSNAAFADDAEQIFKNCWIYNGPDDPLTKQANQLKEYFRAQYLAEFGAHTPTPGRRVP